MLETSALYTDLFQNTYGVEGAVLTDEEVMEVVEDLEYMYCMHILQLTIDTATNAPLSEEEVAAKKAKIEDILAQLTAVENDSDKLYELFGQLMNETTADPGIVESSYGYHIIMRLPITPDSLVDGINSMRYLAASELFTRTTNEWFTNYEVEYEPDFQNLDFSTLFAQG